MSRLQNSSFLCITILETGFRPISLIIAECDELLLTCIKSAQKLDCIESNLVKISSVTLTKTVFLVFQNRFVAFFDDAVATPRGITVSTLSYDPCGGESGFVG